MNGGFLSYCEPVTATPTSYEHIRRVTPPDTRRLGGGIKGPTLCGRDITRGWDLPREVKVRDFAALIGTETNPLCPRCAAAARPADPDRDGEARA